MLQTQCYDIAGLCTYQKMENCLQWAQRDYRYRFTKLI